MQVQCCLQSGAVMNRPFQPHESHVPFLLQFKARQSSMLHPSPACCPVCIQVCMTDIGRDMQIDFNLYGMGLLRLCNVLFRHPVPEARHTRQGWADTPALVPPEGVVFATGLRHAQCWDSTFVCSSTVMLPFFLEVCLLGLRLLFISNYI